jgi:transglutaminase-like putative cysteine protease
MEYTAATEFFDYESAAIQDLIQPYQNTSLSQKEMAVALYLKVRDGWRYNPYRISFNKSDLRASALAKRTEGHCIDKSVLLITCLRALGIPARLHLAKVKNHIAVERLEERFGTNVMTPHGMVNIFLDGKWLKASPAFNASLCEKCRVAPLDFDGTQDAIFQEYNRDGNAFMEYLEDYGHFEDVPMDFILENMKVHYPHLLDWIGEDGILSI